MLAYETDTDATFEQPRQQPYQGVEHDARGAHYDFVACPDLISTALEDFLPFQEFSAVQRFYELLKWLNGSESIFETSDSRLEAPAPNQSPDISQKSLQTILDLVIFYRQRERNLSPQSSERWNSDWATRYAAGDQVALLKHMILSELQLSTDIEACTAVGIFSTHFVEAAVPIDGQLGHSVVVRTWAWGNNASEVFQNLDHAVEQLTQVLKKVSTKVEERLVQFDLLAD